ncbi:MAG: hypothetical protein ACFCVH_22020, partial [Alphaproteobacteria bacterium]
TNQPIGAFRTWEVRHELARLTGARAEPAPSTTLRPWELQFGDGTANFYRGDPMYLMNDLLPRPDGTAILVGTLWLGGEKDVWVLGAGPGGVRLWEHNYRGVPCGGALIDGGFVVLAEDLIGGEDAGVLMLLDDGTAPTGFPTGFEHYAIAPDGIGGFVVTGRQDGAPIVRGYDTGGDTTWTWTAPAADLVGGAETAAVVAATVVPGGRDIRVLGMADRPGDAGVDAVMWTGLLAEDGRPSDVVILGEVHAASLRRCDFVLPHWSIDAVPDGFIVRFDSIDRQAAIRRTTLMGLDAAGAERWRHVLPIDLRDHPDAQAAREAGLDEVTAASATADGGVLLAGLHSRPRGQSAGFVARWDADGEPLWATELRRPGESGSVADAYFAAVVEAADGGILATMTDGVLYMRPRGFLFRLGADGEAP